MRQSGLVESSVFGFNRKSEVRHQSASVAILTRRAERLVGLRVYRSWV